MSDARAKQWTIREGTVADFDAIRRLYLDVWGYRRPDRFDRWRYLTPPDGICPMALAVDGDRLVGAYLIWPVKIRIGDEVVLGAQSMDTMTHPDYQGQGIFTKLAEACFEIARRRGFRLAYGFPNPSSYPGFVRRLGWIHTGDITHWIRVIRPSRHPKMPMLLGGIADAVAAMLPTGRSRGFELIEGMPPHSALEPLLQVWADRGLSCHIERGAEWFAWRYAADAENGYRWVGAYRAGTLMAAAVLGMRTSAWGEVADSRAHLVELIGADQHAVGAVLAGIIREARRGDALLLETLCNVPHVSRALRRAGFYRHRQAPLIVKKLDNTPLQVDALDHARWRIMGGDVDTF